MLALCFNRLLQRFLWLGLMAVGIGAWGQTGKKDIPLRSLGVSDGLPSDVVYHALQDSKGFMWFATETGVTRFNGLEFENFSTLDGLADNEIFHCFEDSKGRIWFDSFNGQLSFYQNGVFHNSMNDPLLARMDSMVHDNSPRGYIAKTFEDPNHNIWFSFRMGTILRLDAHDRPTVFFKNPPSAAQASPIIVFHPQPNGEMVLIGAIFSYTILPNDSLIVHPFFSNVSETYTNGIIIDHEKVLMVGDKKWGYFDVKTMQLQRPASANPFGSLYFLRRDKGEIWSSTVDRGLKLQLDERGLSTKMDFLNGQKISWVMQDNEGNTWVCTLGEGIFFVPTFKVFQLRGASDELVKPIATLYNDAELGILAGMDQFNIALIKENQLDLRTISNSKQTARGRTKDFFRDDSGVLWIVNENYLSRYQNGVIDTAFLSIRSMIKDRVSGNFIMITATAHYEMTPKQLADYFEAGIPSTREFSYVDMLSKVTFSTQPASLVYQDSQNRVWIGGGAGLFEKKGKNLEKISLMNNLPGQTVTAIAEDKQKQLWVGIAGSGVMVIDQDGNQRSISSKDGLSSNFVKHIYVDDQGNIYLATTAGINLLKFEPDGTLRVTVMNMRDGLASNSILDIIRLGDTLYVASTRGLNYFHKEELFQNKRETPPIMVRNLEANPDWQAHIENLVLVPNQKLTIDFAALSFRLAETMRYRYKIAGIDTTWQYTQATHLEFPVLPAGDYLFILQASFPDSDWPEKYASIQFSVQAFLYQKWWFWAIMGAIMASILLLIFYLRQSNIRERRFLTKRADENRQIALRSQMNPHFIFNSLNSLQRFILQNDTDAAYDYTTQFGRLVRAVLENSMLPTISLDREIETLTLYLELESIRFDHRFRWEIKVAPEIPSDKTLVPPTLIQPFVENAIWHGLMPREGAGTVTISIAQKAGLLHFVIEDDGIGREKSAQIHKNKNRMGTASGIKITEERIRAQFMGKAEGPFLQISDRVESGQMAGTRVEFKIPFSTQP